MGGARQLIFHYKRQIWHPISNKKMMTNIFDLFILTEFSYLRIIKSSYYRIKRNGYNLYHHLVGPPRKPLSSIVKCSRSQCLKWKSVDNLKKIFGAAPRVGAASGCFGTKGFALMSLRLPTRRQGKKIKSAKCYGIALSKRNPRKLMRTSGELPSRWAERKYCGK